MSRFKEIEGYNNDYFITEDGDVISVKRGKKILLKKRVNSRGYYYVNLCKNGKYKSICIHRLVGIYFVENNNGFNVLNHIDGNKLNNRYDNLMIFRSNADHTRFHHGAEVYFDKEEIAYCKPVEVKYCSCCGKDLCHDTEGSLCFDCNNKKRREDMLSKYGDITKDKLFEMLKNESFLSVGKKLGVSDNMVRKICDIFGIPRHASYYRKLKD